MPQRPDSVHDSGNGSVLRWRHTPVCAVLEIMVGENREQTDTLKLQSASTTSDSRRSADLLLAGGFDGLQNLVLVAIESEALLPTVVGRLGDGTQAAGIEGEEVDGALRHLGGGGCEEAGDSVFDYFRNASRGECDYGYAGGECFQDDASRGFVAR